MAPNKATILPFQPVFKSMLGFGIPIEGAGAVAADLAAVADALGAAGAAGRADADAVADLAG